MKLSEGFSKTARPAAPGQHWSVASAVFLLYAAAAAAIASADTRLTTLHRFAEKPHSVRATLTLSSDGNYYGVSVSGGLYRAGTVFRVTPSGDLKTVHSFSPTGTAGVNPRSALVEGPDGMLYGSTSTGGSGGTGTIFKIAPGGALTTLHNFSGSQGNPSALTLGSDGNLYGTFAPFFSWTDSKVGTVFRISPTGAFAVVHAFQRNKSGEMPAGGYPNGLTRGSDGALYGTTRLGGAHGAGTFFRVSPPAGFTTIRSFAEGQGFSSTLAAGKAGKLYGTSHGGTGARPHGYVASITEAGDFMELYVFTGGADGSGGDESGADGYAMVLLGSDGNLYGTAPSGGSLGYGTVFRLTPSGAFNVLHTFANGADGAKPKFGLVENNTGKLVGVTSGDATGKPGSAFEITKDGDFSTLLVFTPTTDGNTPVGQMVQAPDGSFYGVTSGGVTAAATVFRLDRHGAVTTLHEFNQATDGTSPNGLCLGRDGNLYGTTKGGGPGSGGTIYRVTPGGVFSILRSFGDVDVARQPSSPLVEVADGEFYGTLRADSGAVFRITSGGEFSIVYSFTGGADGAEPEGKLAWDGTDTFYGTTSWKGPKGAGTIFKLTGAGQLTTLYAFSGREDGGDARDLLIGHDGNLYGFTGDELGDYLSTIFRFTTDGVFTTLHTFPAGSVAGALVQRADQHLYGIARGGKGFVFRLGTSGGLVRLHDFSGGINGEDPSGLMLARNGHLYGTTATGPSGGGLGTIFKLEISPSDLLNISTRLRVQTGENVMIGGFIVAGSAPKKVMIRGIGPSLQGVDGRLADPTLELRTATGQLVAKNDDWKESQAGDIQDTTIPPANDFESAIVRTLAPGAYTAILSGKNAATGVALVEAYDLDATADSKLANISTRGFVETGDSVMIGGVIVGGGTSPVEVLVRAIGPSLQQAGVSGSLKDPTLELRDRDGGLIAANNDWQDDPAQAARISATGVPPQHLKESAIVTTLPPAPATAIVRGAGGSTGVALVEIYNIE